MRDDHWITVVDVARMMDVEPEPELMWSVGAVDRNKWYEIHGDLPTKTLRPKTYGAGVHCFAVYPHEFRPVIEGVLLQYVTSKANQMGLF